MYYRITYLLSHLMITTIGTIRWYLPPQLDGTKNKERDEGEGHLTSDRDKKVDTWRVVSLSKVGFISIWVGKISAVNIYVHICSLLTPAGCPLWITYTLKLLSQAYTYITYIKYSVTNIPISHISTKEIAISYAYAIHSMYV